MFTVNWLRALRVNRKNRRKALEKRRRQAAIQVQLGVETLEPRSLMAGDLSLAPVQGEFDHGHEVNDGAAIVGPLSTAEAAFQSAPVQFQAQDGLAGGQVNTF